MLNSDSLLWETVETGGNQPPPRANHSSAVLGNKIFIFGGWDGSKRLNDLHLLDIGIVILLNFIENKTWTEIKANSEVPSPRAGMTLSAVKDRLYLFGGSGPSATCFFDLHLFNYS